MPDEASCVCCCEHPELKKMMEAEDLEEHPSCIIQHPGFADVALSRWTLDAAYYTFRQRYGEINDVSTNERYRYIAYRNTVRWCWGYLGRDIRVALPSCVISAIRSRFPSETYTGLELNR